MIKIATNPYLLAIGMSLLAYILLWLTKLVFTVKMEKFLGDTKNKWDDIVVFSMERTSQVFIIACSLVLGIKFIPQTKKVSLYTDRLFFIILMYQIAVWSHYLLEKWIHHTVRQGTSKNPSAASSISLLQLLGRMILYTFIFLFTLSNLGIKITTIIAGLGVGGIAVALALQRILGDLFSSLSIVLDKPFVVGDFIVIDQFMGEVEKIGLKTTRLRSLSGEQIIFSNSDLLATRIRNYKRMHERRVSFSLNLPHQISSDRLKTAVSLICAIVRSKSRVRFERCHFMKMNSSSHDLETVYWVLSDDYDLFMDIHQDILFDIKNTFEMEKIMLAYPTQTVNVLPTEVLMRSDQNTQRHSRGSEDSIVS